MAAWEGANLRALKAAAFSGLVLWFPCPWYLVAIGGLLPLPVIVLYGLEGGVMLVFSLVHLSFAPIYGSGENLAAGGKLNRNAWQVYAEEFKR